MASAILRGALVCVSIGTLLIMSRFTEFVDVPSGNTARSLLWMSVIGFGVSFTLSFARLGAPSLKSRCLPRPVNWVSGTATFWMYFCTNFLLAFLLLAGLSSTGLNEADVSEFTGSPRQLFVGFCLLLAGVHVTFVPLFRAWAYNDGLEPLLFLGGLLALLVIGQVAPSGAVIDFDELGRFFRVLFGQV